MTDSGSRTRLSVGDWVQAGFGVIADDGLKALTVDRLCRRVGATKGSFYWHFTDLSAYRTALIETWGTVSDEERGRFDALIDQPPRDRLRTMMGALVSPRLWMLERAMREWARSEPTVAAAVRASDRRVLAAVRQAFVDAGFEGEDADVRTSATFAAGIGFLHLSGEQTSPPGTADRERFLDIMLRR